jgi:hypothetical protein
MAVGDLNNDGRIDIVVTTNGGAAHILDNETATSNHWLRLNLVGHKSNRDAIGAEVKVTTSKGNQLVTVSTTGGISHPTTNELTSVWAPMRSPARSRSAGRAGSCRSSRTYEPTRF